MTEMEQAPAAVQQPGEVEQITKEPEKDSKKAEKIKDPKKVKAGKAAKNKEARAAKAAAEKKREEDDQDSGNLISNIQLAGSVVGAGFVLWHGWKVAEPFVTKALSSDKKESTTERESTPSPPPPPPPPPPSPEKGILME